MMARKTLIGILVGLAGLVAAGAAAAQCCTTPPPPSCCKAPPPPPPPSAPPCCTPGHSVNVPGVNVFVGGAVTVNAAASARASAGAAGTSTVFVGGGGGYVGGYAPPAADGIIQGLNVGGTKRVAYQATRSRTKKVIIQAVCMDDRFVAHPASQVRPDRDIDAAFDGELYRCLAGTRLQWTYAEYLGKIDFEKGQSSTCGKGEALYHSAGGKLSCRPQKPARNCNERSLLRRFGAGVKILTMTVVETYTAYREETESTSASMSLDGGVGGVVY
jgi:hypothetical protein